MTRRESDWPEVLYVARTRTATVEKPLTLVYVHQLDSVRIRYRAFPWAWEPNQTHTGTEGDPGNWPGGCCGPLPAQLGHDRCEQTVPAGTVYRRFSTVYGFGFWILEGSARFGVLLGCSALPVMRADFPARVSLH